MQNQIILSQETKESLIQEILLGFKQIIEEQKKPSQELKEWLTAKETQELLKISSGTRWSWSKSGKLKAHSIQGTNRIRYHRDQVLSILSERETV